MKVKGSHNASFTWLLFVIALALASCSDIQHVAKKGDEGGFSGEAHGGNPAVKRKVDEAKKIAPSVLRGLNVGLIKSISRDRVRAFFLDNRNAAEPTIRLNKEGLKLTEVWARDIESSHHDWPETEEEEQQRLKKYPRHLRDRSSVTKGHEKADLEFSWTVAESKIKSLDDAVDVVLHEGLHHLEIKDESLVKLIVSEVIGIWKKTRVPSRTALVKPICDRLLHYYLLSGESRSNFISRCPSLIEVELEKVTKLPPYDVVVGAVATFKLVLNGLSCKECFKVKGYAYFSKEQSHQVALDLLGSWRVNHLSLFSPGFNEDVAEYFQILKNKPDVAHIKGELGTKILIQRYGSGVEHANFRDAFDMMNPYSGKHGIEITEIEDQIVYYVSGTGKKWPLAYLTDCFVNSDTGDVDSGFKQEINYVTTRSAATYVDQVPVLPKQVNSFNGYGVTGTVAVGWNHISYLSSHPFTHLSFIGERDRVKSMAVQLKSQLRKIRIAAVEIPPLKVFEKLVKDFREQIIVYENFTTSKQAYNSELNELYAQYFLRRARVNEGDGIIEYLRFVGGNNKILRYGLTKAELTFLVLRAYKKFLDSAHKVPENRRSQVFGNYLAMLDWTFEGLGITSAMLEQVHAKNDYLLRTFTFYDKVQVAIKKWQRESAHGSGTRFDLNNTIKALSMEWSLSLASSHLSEEILSDAERVSNVIKAATILEELLPLLGGDMENMDVVIKVLDLADDFRKAADKSLYPREYLLVGVDDLPQHPSIEKGVIRDDGSELWEPQYYRDLEGINGVYGLAQISVQRSFLDGFVLSQLPMVMLDPPKTVTTSLLVGSASAAQAALEARPYTARELEVIFGRYGFRY